MNPQRVREDLSILPGLCLGIVITAITHEQIHALAAYLLGLRITGYAPLEYVYVAPSNSMVLPYSYAIWIVIFAPYLFYMIVGIFAIAKFNTFFSRGLTFSFVIGQPWIMILSSLLIQAAPESAQIMTAFGIEGHTDLLVLLAVNPPLLSSMLISLFVEITALCAFLFMVILYRSDEPEGKA